MIKISNKLKALSTWMNSQNLFSAAKLIKKLAFNAFEQQIYSDDRGQWKAEEIVKFAEENSDLIWFSVDKLGEIAFMKSEGEEFDEVPGSPEFIERAMQTDLSYPIVVVIYNDGAFIADGNHRLWKAQAEGQKLIKGYLLTKEHLEEVPKFLEVDQ